MTGVTDWLRAKCGWGWKRCPP